MNKEAVQHERGPRNSTIRRQVALYLKESAAAGPSPLAHIPAHLRPLEAHLNGSGMGHTSLGHHPGSLFPHPLLSEEQANAIFSAARLPFPFLPPTSLSSSVSPSSSSPPVTRLDARSERLPTQPLAQTPIPWHTLFPRMSSMSQSTGNLSSLFHPSVTTGGHFPIFPTVASSMYSNLSSLEQYAYLWRESLLRTAIPGVGTNVSNAHSGSNGSINGLTSSLSDSRR